MKYLYTYIHKLLSKVNFDYIFTCFFYVRKQSYSSFQRNTQWQVNQNEKCHERLKNIDEK